VTHPFASRPRLLGMALLVATFVAGGLAGAASSRVLAAREPAAHPAASDEGRRCQGDRGPGGATMRILNQLDLSAGQRARIDTITARRRAQMDAFWEGPEGRRMRAIVDSARAEIRAVLTPTQAAEYDRLKAEHKRRHAGRRDSAGDASGER
jgi:Spy/CpxP family protein refolding chaperone